MLMEAALSLVPFSLVAFEGSGINPPAAGAIGCLFVVMGWAILSLLAFSALMIRKRFRPSTKGRPDPLNLRASGKTPVSGSSSNTGSTN